jgi:hypothetical protein
MAVYFIALLMIVAGKVGLKAAVANQTEVAMKKQMVHRKMVVSMLKCISAIGTAAIGGALSA